MSEETNNQEEEELFEHHNIIVDPKQSLLRIDRFLFDRLPNVTRNKIQSGIKDGFVKVNDREVKPNYKVHPGDQISVFLTTPPREDVVVPENIPLDIVYEDRDLLVVNKSAGMVVHPAYQNWSGTLVNALAVSFRKPTGDERQCGTTRAGSSHR